MPFQVLAVRLGMSIIRNRNRRVVELIVTAPVIEILPQTPSNPKQVVGCNRHIPAIVQTVQITPGEQAVVHPMLSPTTIRYDVRCIQDRSRVLPRNRAGTVIRISNGQGEESLSQPPLHHGSAPISSRVLNTGPRIHINVPVTIIPGSALHALPENTVALT